MFKRLGPPYFALLHTVRWNAPRLIGPSNLERFDLILPQYRNIPQEKQASFANQTIKMLYSSNILVVFLMINFNFIF